MSTQPKIPGNGTPGRRRFVRALKVTATTVCSLTLGAWIISLLCFMSYQGPEYDLRMYRGCIEYLRHPPHIDRYRALPGRELGWYAGWDTHSRHVISKGVFIGKWLPYVDQSPHWVVNPANMQTVSVLDTRYVFPLSIPLVILLFAAAVAWRHEIRGIYRRLAGRYPRNHCQSCGYNLSGNESGVCSECGSNILLE